MLTRGLTLNGGLISEVNAVRHLGLLLTSSLSWSEYVHLALRKVGWKGSLLKRLPFRAQFSLPKFPFSINVLLVLAWSMRVLFGMAAPRLIPILSNAFNFLLLSL